MFKEDVINSIVSGIPNVPGDDQCVLLLGYEDEMLEMFQVRCPSIFDLRGSDLTRNIELQSGT